MNWAMETIHQLSDYPIYIAVLISFLAGLVTSFNPCMLGMASSIAAFQDDTKKKSQMPVILAFMLSFAITLTLLGVISSFFGDQVLQWSEQFGSTLYKLLAVIFVLVGCYLFGLRIHHLFHWLPFTIVAFYSKSKPKNKKPAPPIIRAFSLGSLFGVTPSPCTTPVVLAMLAYTTITQSTLLGGLLLFSYGIGHGIPFLIIGWLTGAVKRSKWMVRWHRLLNKGLASGLILIGLYFFFYENTPMSM
jgi:cytochrome c-type biogenesis protein